MQNLGMEKEIRGENFCIECHGKVSDEATFEELLSRSIHSDFDCQDCHEDKTDYPHESVPGFSVWYNSCINCHDIQAEQYQIHGGSEVDTSHDIPVCAECHGGHTILPPTEKESSVHPENLSDTCGLCHKDPKLIEKYENLSLRPVSTYRANIHSRAYGESKSIAASCLDCHSSGGIPHRILSSKDKESSINPENLLRTCGKCHPEISAQETARPFHSE